MPPLSIVVGLLAGFASLLVVAQGTFRATDVVFSAKERLELIEQTVAEQTSMGVTVIGTTRYCGRVTTADDAPLPDGAVFSQFTSEPRSSTLTGLSLDRQSGRFSTVATGTSATLWLCVPGYTPSGVGPMVPGPEPVTDLGEWVLIPQTPLPIRVLDDHDQPVPAAKVHPYWQLGTDMTSNGPDQVTDLRGECAVPLVTEYPMSLTVEAAGFEPAKFADLNPPNDEPLVFHLTPALPLVLKVLDQRTGLPVAGAKIDKLADFGPITSSVRSLDDAPNVGTSTLDGSCVLSNLHREGAYWFLVQAPGYGTELVENARPGERREVRLGPPRVVTGTITGNLGNLASDRKGAMVYIGYNIMRAESNYANRCTWVPVRIENGVGTFRIDSLWAGSFDLSAGKSVRLSTKAGNVHLAIDLPATSPAEAEIPTREIRLTFVEQPDLPLPRGTLRVSYQALPDTYNSEHDLPVVDGVVSFHAPVGKQVNYTATGVIGGWFPGGRISPVPAGDDPLVIQLPCVPAGAISVSVFEADGSPAAGFMVSIQELAQSPQRSGSFLHVDGKGSASSDDGIHAFTATPLPLGGTYALVVYRKYAYVTTGPVELSEKYPLHVQRLVLSGDATIVGQVVGPDGKPLAKAPVSMSLRLGSSSFGASDIRTDADGWFEFPGVVRQRDGQYAVNFVPVRDFMPQYIPVPDLDQPLRVVAEPGLVLGGRVLNEENDAPIRDAKVWAQRTTGLAAARFLRFEAEKSTDDEGRFRISTLPPGEYRLHCDRPDRNYSHDSPLLTAGQSGPIVWRVTVKR